MTHDDIIRMAREASFIWDELGLLDRLAFYKFADLIAAAEREACAMYLERGVDLGGLAGHPGWQNYTADLLAGCAAVMRARRNT
jgi:hypothetical protein